MTHEAKKPLFDSRMEGEQQPALFLKCAQLILPWLPPLDLASISSTCKTLHHVSKSITTIRCSDASRNFENHPIPFINTFDSQPYSYFIYTPVQILALPSLPSQQWGHLHPPNLPNIISNFSENPPFYPKPTSVLSVSLENANGCFCKDCLAEDEETQCPCSRLNPKSLMELGFDSEMMTECGPSCGCELGCGNRLTQRGVSVRLRIVKEGRKGWGLYADQFIQQGQFICEYAGELLTTAEARRRQKIYDELTPGGQFSSALLVVREHLPSGKACFRINIDATRVGNVARFINHSCDGGNLLTVLVRNTGVLLPRLCFFAARDILEGEELVFSYGEVRLRPNGLPCYCGCSACFGILPSEQT